MKRERRPKKNMINDDIIFHVDTGICYAVLERRLLSEGYNLSDIQDSINNMINLGTLIKHQYQDWITVNWNIVGI